MKVSIITAVLLVLLASGIVGSDIPLADLHSKGILLEPIGADEFLMVINTEADGGAYWFVLKEMGRSRYIGSGLSAFLQVHQLLASPDRKYLAVYSVGEGHPIIEVIDLQGLLNHSKYTVLQEINPYPGAAGIERWEGLQLIVSSDVPLTLRKKDGRVPDYLMLPKNEEFFLDMATGIMGSHTFDIAALLRHYSANLTASSPYVRIEAAYAIKALESKDAVPKLEQALKNETNPDVINALKEALNSLKKPDN